MKKTFHAQMNQLAGMLDWVRGKLEKTLDQPSEIRRFEIAIEEAIVNILKHGYKNNSGEIRLYFAYFPKDRMEITIEDNGQAFNPLLEMTPLNITASLEERKIGGLGIPLILRNVDDVRYERIGISNRLTLVKSFKLDLLRN